MPVPPSLPGLAALPFAERLMLWTMRAWVMGVHRGNPTTTQIEAAFAKAGVQEAAEDLERFMVTFARGASRQIAVDCICKQQVSADERRLLDILSCHQHGRALDALALLRSMMHPRQAAAASWEAGKLADRIKAVGYLLDPAEADRKAPVPSGADEWAKLPHTLH